MLSPLLLLGTAVFLASSGGQCWDKQNMNISTLGTYRVQHLDINILDQKLGCGNDLWTPQVRSTNNLAWPTKSVGSDHKYWPPLETAVTWGLKILTTIIYFSLCQAFALNYTIEIILNCYWIAIKLKSMSSVFGCLPDDLTDKKCEMRKIR